MESVKPRVFMSCSEAHKDLARYYRDVLDAAGYEGLIVSCLPSLGMEPDAKVDHYMNLSVAALVLLTPDDELEDGSYQPRPNIADEVGRLRSRPALRSRAIFLKHSSVILHTNINPTYIPFDDTARSQQQATIAVLRELRSMNLATQVASTAATISPRTGHAMLEGLAPEDSQKIENRARAEMLLLSKQAQGEMVRGLIDIATNVSREEHDARWLAARLLEYVLEHDSSLVPVQTIVRLTEDPYLGVRSSAAYMLYQLSLTLPGVVPIDVVEKLAVPSSNDWYVFMPSLAALKQLSRTRPLAVNALVRLTRSSNPEDREYAAAALREIAGHWPAAVPASVARELLQDDDPGVRRIAQELLPLVDDIPEDARRNFYSPFSPF